MKLRIEKERLIITADEDERKILQTIKDEDPGCFESEMCYDLLEKLFTDDEFQWTSPIVTGDMLSDDVPILAIFGDPEDVKHENCNGFDYEGCPVLYRWVFMDYAVAFVQEHLLEFGEAKFTGGKYMDRGQAELLNKNFEFSMRD